MRFTIFQDSKVGDRKGNEDRVGYTYSRDVLLMVIADGMGGHLQGEVAAEIAVTEITRRFQQEARNKLKKPFDFLVSAIQSAHRAIVSHAVEENLLECPRTTCVACVVQNGTLREGDARTVALVDGLARRPETWRATFVTSVLDAKPEAIVRLSEPSWWPLISGLCLTLVFVGELIDSYPLLGASFLGYVLSSIVWLWPSKEERVIPELDADGTIHGLPVYVHGPQAPAWW